MEFKSVRKGITQANFNDSASTFLFGEIAIISIIAGISTLNWTVFGIVLLGLIAFTCFRKGAIILIILFSICWTIIGLLIGGMLGGPIAGIIFGIIALIVSAGFHIGALEWMDDMRNSNVSVQNENHSDTRELWKRYNAMQFAYSNNPLSFPNGEIIRYENWYNNPYSEPNIENWYQTNRKHFSDHQESYS
ncbi:hypothetical protein [Halalkalibacter sp. APA_J-10(15)]|uniref:hypothetical protein n=1 Tax=Halalkalibacter sp. APA_J-10(15) TaxID=2933805 RepID=UPI001FF43081|nr:hypothetical protein [Halalkalibacter sp. APA_J-10(15)]MCK0470409.1 hypothetical protein [Halalkalibacter sp. APA_J-10(15)]